MWLYKWEKINPTKGIKDVTNKQGLKKQIATRFIKYISHNSHYLIAALFTVQGNIVHNGTSVELEGNVHSVNFKIFKANLIPRLLNHH